MTVIHDPLRCEPCWLCRGQGIRPDPEAEALRVRGEALPEHMLLTVIPCPRCSGMGKLWRPYLIKTEDMEEGCSCGGRVRSEFETDWPEAWEPIICMDCKYTIDTRRIATTMTPCPTCGQSPYECALIEYENATTYKAAWLPQGEGN